MLAKDMKGHHDLVDIGPAFNLFTRFPILSLEQRCSYRDGLIFFQILPT